MLVLLSPVHLACFLVPTSTPYGLCSVFLQLKMFPLKPSQPLSLGGRHSPLRSLPSALSHPPHTGLHAALPRPVTLPSPDCDLGRLSSWSALTPGLCTARSASMSLWGAVTSHLCSPFLSLLRCLVQHLQIVDLSVHHSLVVLWQQGCVVH